MLKRIQHSSTEKYSKQQGYGNSEIDTRVNRDTSSRALTAHNTSFETVAYPEKITPRSKEQGQYFSIIQWSLLEQSQIDMDATLVTEL